MSNLTDLLPAGAGGKQVNFVASGTIGNGVTVVLNSDGTVSAVAATGGPLSVGTSAVFEAAALPTSNDTSIVFDPVNNKVVITYPDAGNSNYGTAIVGTVSGTSITFGTPVVFFTSAISNTRLVFDSNSNKVVEAHRRTSNLYGYAMVGTVSGTSISFGFSAIFNYATSYNIEAAFDSNSNKVVIAYRDSGNSNYGTAIVGTVSGTSISYGSPTVFNSALSVPYGCVFDSSNNKTITAYYDGGNSNYGTAIVGTVSGTSISFGTASVFKSAATFVMNIAFDSLANKTVIVYKPSSPNTVSAVVGTVSGTSISFGAEANISGTYSPNRVSVTYDSSANKVVAFFNDDLTSYTGYASVGAISGTSITFDSPIAFSGVQTYSIVSTFDSNANKVVVAYTDAGNSSYGTAAVVTTSGSNSADFIGISDAAVSDTASGSVTIKGGISTNVTGLTPNATYYVQADGSLASGNIPYSISGASYDSVNFSVTSQDSSPKGISFNANGTKMFVVGQTNDSVYEYALTTAYDVSTASHSQSFSVASQDANPRGIAFNTAGTKMFVVGYAESRVNEYALATGFDVSTASFSQFFSVASQDSTPQGIAFNTDGTKMFVVGNTGDSVYEYSLTTGFNVSTASFVDSFSVSSEETGPFGVAFNSNGTRMFISGTTPDEVSEYTLTTGFDVSTASYSGISFSVLSQDNQIEDLAFSQDGNKMYVVGNQNDSVYQYSTTAASTTVPAGKALSSTSINLDYTT